MSDPTTLTSKGQVTVPKEIRQQLGLKTGDKLMFTLLADGTVIVRPKTRRAEEVAGILKRPGQRRVPTEALRMGEESALPDRVESAQMVFKPLEAHGWVETGGRTSAPAPKRRKVTTSK